YAFGFVEYAQQWSQVEDVVSDTDKCISNFYMQHIVLQYAERIPEKVTILPPSTQQRVFCLKTKHRIYDVFTSDNNTRSLMYVRRFDSQHALFTRYCLPSRLFYNKCHGVTFIKQP